MKHVLALIVCVLLVGCGFHPRGTHEAFQIPFQTLELKPYLQHDPFHKKLRERLKSHGISQLENAPYVLELDPLVLQTAPVAYGSNGELAREKLLLSLSYRLLSEGRLMKKDVIQTERQHQRNNTLMIANEEEQRMIIQEMHTDLVQQLVMQLSHL